MIFTTFLTSPYHDHSRHILSYSLNLLLFIFKRDYMSRGTEFDGVGNIASLIGCTVAAMLHYIRLRQTAASFFQPQDSCFLTHTTIH